ncbi:MAG: hypothetical protein SOZ62_00445 [Eubacteriales bacterium]|nr:hypothetical protein [Eubacteriales bacterium]
MMFEYYYDSPGQLSRVDDFRGSVDYSYTYEYDNGGNILQICKYVTSDNLGSPISVINYSYDGDKMVHR